MGKCKQTKHSVVRQGDRLCISQIPIVECGSGCSPRSEIVKEVTFTCLPANRERVNKLYAQKVKRGEILPELRPWTRPSLSECLFLSPAPTPLCKNCTSTLHNFEKFNILI